MHKRMKNADKQMFELTLDDKTLRQVNKLFQ